ncbi:alpha-endosulfine isoform X1 [Gopherus flavomarginatus]|uniref:alpha-endosulfine isoform X1 n=1 Tax=Gopherus flavomarginatus TaxID=286002 RepID=UPI0021CBDE0E|nr:alpha-endosulfine isoform X1 [Gopherus flavomarginatus]
MLMRWIHVNNNSMLKQQNLISATHLDTQEKEAVVPERAEEAKLKAKYPNLGQKPGGSDFLMKRLQKGQKYFDSGDYNMAKAKMKNKQLPTTGPDNNLVTGDHIPTPQDLPPRKSSLVTSKLAGCIWPALFPPIDLPCNQEDYSTAADGIRLIT